jgi:hypothetical protein
LYFEKGGYRCPNSSPGISANLLVVVSDTELGDKTGLRTCLQGCLELTFTTQELFRPNRCMPQCLLHQVANRVRGRWGGVAAGVGPVNVNLVSTSGFRLRKAETDEKPLGATVEMPPSRRQRINAIGDDHLDAALKIDHHRHAVAGDLHPELVPKRSASSAQISA